MRKVQKAQVDLTRAGERGTLDEIAGEMDHMNAVIMLSLVVLVLLSLLIREDFALGRASR
jgi:hypothetical protein